MTSKISALGEFGVQFVLSSEEHLLKFDRSDVADLLVGRMLKRIGDTNRDYLWFVFEDDSQVFVPFARVVYEERRPTK